MKKVYKELQELWSWLSFVLWCGNMRKASETCEKINTIARQHPILNFCAMFTYPFKEFI
jgi:hypothetical protein